MSIGTHPVGVGDETFPSFRSRSNVFANNSLRSSRDQSRLLILIATLIVTGVVSTVAIKMISEMLGK
jgi:hypothetical protein